MRKLLEGILDFQAKREAGSELLFQKLSQGQNPDALFITCSDSRVVPNLLASTNPGDLFVIRNVGNVVPPCCEHSGYSQTDDSEIAALEYALIFLHIRDIIVCGHSNCGAIQSICSDADTHSAPHLKSWLGHAKQALNQFEPRLLFDKPWPAHDQISQKNVLLQLEHLKTYQLIQKALAEKKVSLHGWWFEIESRDIYTYRSEENKFKIIDNQEKDRILATRI
ncbi:carbonic anhydrase [bacterium]|nr:carbonic anhydrase [bacterium]